MKTVINVSIASTVHLKSVIFKSNCHILQFLHQMFYVSALLLDDALKLAAPLTNGMINERCDSLPHKVTFHKVV